MALTGLASWLRCKTIFRCATCQIRCPSAVSPHPRPAEDAMMSPSSGTDVRGYRTSAALSRWHADRIANRHLYRYGYKDTVKQSGALARISEDGPRLKTMKVFTPANPFAPKRALFGQNDYIDILGEDPDAFRPSELNYQAPEWLREIPGKSTAYQMALKRKAHLEKTAYPAMNPLSWSKLTKRIARTYNELRKHRNQMRWTNYKGIKTGDATKHAFTTKYPF